MLAFARGGSIPIQGTILTKPAASSMRRFLFIIPLLLLPACAGPTTQYTQAVGQDVAVEAERQEGIARAKGIRTTYTPNNVSDESYRPEDRLAMIAGRVMTAAAPYCENRVRNSFLLSARALGDEPPIITAPIAVRAAGETSNIKQGDRVLALNGQALYAGTEGIKQMANILNNAADANENVQFKVRRKSNGNELSVALKPVLTCAYGPVVQQAKEVNAYADGNRMYFTTMIMDMLTDDELAFVVAHELSHNILGHVAKQQNNVALGALGGTLIDAIAKSQGVGTGGRLGQMGAQVGGMRFSQDFEREADYVGMYITELSGFAPEAAVAVIEKLSKQNPDQIRYANTHPANAERAVNARLTLDEIRRKIRNKEPLYPNMRPQE
jgi:hypothetical protein